MKNKNMRIISRLMFRLLPVQILVAVVGSINGIVSSYFATNHLGIEAMSAVGLYGPISQLLGALSTVLVGGCAIICGKYLGSNQQDRVQDVFSLDLLISLIISVVNISVMSFLALSELTVIFTRDLTIRPIFNTYLLGQMIGIVPMMIANQLPCFLSMENKGRRTITASLIYIAVNVV